MFALVNISTTGCTLRRSLCLFFITAEWDGFLESCTIDISLGLDQVQSDELLDGALAADRIGLVKISMSRLCVDIAVRVNLIYLTRSLQFSALLRPES